MKTLIRAVTVAAILTASGIANAAVPVCPAPTASAPKRLEAGCAPPPFKVFKWIKGKPVTKFKKGSVYVVEFWATWCPPCRTSIPHLTELAKKYAGKVTFIGVNVWDSTDRATRKPYSEKEYIEHVSAFVKEQGDKMDYNVALDDIKGTIAETWATAAKIPGIPSAFVIGKDGKIAVIIHPMELDNILGKIVAGKFDGKAFSKEQNEKDAKANAEQEKFQKAFAKVMELDNEKKYKEALEECNKALAANPEYEPQVALGKLELLLKSDESAGYVYGKQLAEGIYKDNAMALNQLARMILENKELKSPDYDFVLSVAEKSSSLAKDENFYLLETVAAANFSKGNVDKAIEIQENVVKLSEANAQANEEQKKTIKDKLAEYQKKKDGK